MKKNKKENFYNEDSPKILKKDKNGFFVLPKIITRDYGYQLMFGWTKPTDSRNRRYHDYKYEL